MRGKIWKKLRSRSGESIGETLVALVISTLGIMMLAVMIVTSTRLTSDSQKTLNEYYLNNNTVSEQVVASSKGNLTITLTDNSVSTPLTTKTLGGADGNVYCFVNDKLANKEVVSYSYVRLAGGTP